MLRAARHDPKIMRDCLRRAFLDWLAAECAAGPVLVVLDDLQWGDALTVSALEDALGEQAGAPLFVIALARPEVHEVFPRLWHRYKVQQIALRGLSKKACERLIRDVLGKDVPAVLVERAIEQAAGNALFLEEMIRGIAEGKGEEQPETVVAMLQARIGRLPAGPRRALQAASVFGQTCWDGGVARVLGLPAPSAEVADGLSVLVEAELIEPSPTSRLHGEREHAFRHALVRDAAYGLLTASDVATGHRLAGEFLEAAGERDAAIIAEHFERGGERKQAATFYVRAANESLPRGDYASARRLCDRGLGCAPEGELLGELKSVHCYAATLLNTSEGVSDAARTAMALTRPGSLGWCRALAAACLGSGNDPARMLELMSLIRTTDPEREAGACVAHLDAQTWAILLATIAAPEPVVRAHLDRMEHFRRLGERHPPGEPPVLLLRARLRHGIPVSTTLERDHRLQPGPPAGARGGRSPDRDRGASRGGRVLLARDGRCRRGLPADARDRGGALPEPRGAGLLGHGAVHRARSLRGG
jgi:hypothetical protein